MPDALSVLVLRILDAGQQHPWLFAALALPLLFACVFMLARALRGTPVPGRFNCRACRHPCVPGFAAGAAGAAAGASGGTVRCPECGSSIARRHEVVQAMVPRRLAPALAWASAAACLVAWAVLVDENRLNRWLGSWAASLGSATILPGLRNGDIATARAAAAALGSADAVLFTSNEYLQAVRQSPQFTHADVPARAVWQFAASVERGWDDARDGIWQQGSGGSALAWPHLPYSAISDTPPWPQPALVEMCGHGRPHSTEFKAKRTLEDSEVARAFGAVLARWPWELIVIDRRSATLRWLAPEQCLWDLPLRVAGSYRVVVRKGPATIATGALVVCQTGPGHTWSRGGRCECVMSNIAGLAVDQVMDGATLSLDLYPDAAVRLSMPGEGLLRPECPPLRCDPAPHLGMPLHVRLNGVPGRLLSAAP